MIKKLVFILTALFVLFSFAISFASESEEATEAYKFLEQGRRALSFWKFDESEYLFKKALQSDPTLKEAPRQLILLYAKTGRFDEALFKTREFSESMHFEKKDTMLLEGLIYSAKRDNQKAEIRFKEVLNIDPNSADALNNLGIIYTRENKLTEAKEVLEKAITIKDIPEYKVNLAGVFIKQKDFASAEVILAQILKDSPENFQAMVSEAVICINQDNFSESKTYLQKALKINPHCESAFYDLALVYYNLGEYRLAQETLYEITDSGIFYPEAHLALAEALVKLNRPQEAVIEANLAIENQSDYIEAYLSLSNILIDLDNLQTAESTIKRAVALKPDYFALHNNLGVVYFKQKKYPQAVSAFLKVIELNPQYAPAYFNLAQSYELTGDKNKALKYYKKYLELDPQSSKIGLIKEKITSLEK